MKLLNWLRSSRKNRPVTRSCKPHLEALEDRTVPSAVSIAIADVTINEIGNLTPFVQGIPGVLLNSADVAFGPDRNADSTNDLYVVGRFSDNVVVYDGNTGAYIEEFVGPASGLDGPAWLAFAPDGDVLVSTVTATTGKRDAVLRVDQATKGVSTFVSSGAGGLEGAKGMAFGPDGNFYVASANTDQVLRYDGASGAFIDAFVATGSGGLDGPGAALFGPDRNGDTVGDLYVSSSLTDQVLVYSGADGTTLGVFVTTGSGGLDAPHDMEFGTDGHLYVVHSGTSNEQIYRFDGNTGAFVDIILPAGSGLQPETSFIAFDSQGELYVSSENASAVLRDRAGPLVTLSAPSDTTVTVNFTTVDGNAIGGSDYTAQTGTLVFKPGETSRRILLAPLDDVSVEGNEAFTVQLSNPTGGGTIADGEATVTILDNDTPIPTPSGIVSWWTGDGNGTDLVGPNGGTLNSGVTFAPGEVASGFSFNGASYVSANTSGLPTGNSDRTMEMWVKVNAFGVNETFFAGYGGFGSTNQTYHLGTNSGQQLFFSQWGQSISGGPNLQAGVWNHIAVANVGNSVTLYLNGAAVASGTLTLATPSNSQFYIGRIPGSLGDTRQLNGMVDEVSVYNRSLSAAEIQGIYDAGSQGKNKFSGTKFYVVNDGSTDRTYEYGSSGGAGQNYALTSGNTAPRGAASTAAGTTVWVVDANKKVYVYNTAGVLQGSWTAGGLPANAQVEDIATNGTDIWLLDNKSDKVYKYTGAASRLSGSQNAASSFSLASGNTNGKGIVTDGASLWVVNDASTDKVFKYTLSGTLLGSWTIDAANSSPTGITLDPSNPQHLWIVDSGTDKIYQYDNAVSRTSGSQSASTSFALAAGNTNPQGIADPPASSEALIATPVKASPAILQTQAVQTAAIIDGRAWGLAETPVVGGGSSHAADFVRDATTPADKAHGTASPAPALSATTRGASAIDQVFVGDIDSWLDLPAVLGILRSGPAGRKI